MTKEQQEDLNAWRRFLKEYDPVRIMVVEIDEEPFIATADPDTDIQEYDDECIT
jgi:hypothetical protein